MNTQRWLIGSLVVFVFFFLFEFLLHGVLMEAEYQKIADISRSEADMLEKFYFIPLGELIMAFFFCLIFTKGYENKGIMEGVRYGLLISIGFGLAGFLIQYAVYPYPFSTIIWWTVGTIVEMVIAGILIAIIYKPKTA